MRRIVDDYEFEGYVTSFIKSKLTDKLPTVKVNFIDIDYYPDNGDFMFDTYVATKKEYNLSEQLTTKAISRSTANYISNELIGKIEGSNEVRKGNILDEINIVVQNSKLEESEDLNTQVASFFIDVKFKFKMKR